MIVCDAIVNNTQGNEICKLRELGHQRINLSCAPFQCSTHLSMCSACNPVLRPNDRVLMLSTPNLERACFLRFIIEPRGRRAFPLSGILFISSQQQSSYENEKEINFSSL
jgi:hypothetical protein